MAWKVQPEIKLGVPQGKRVSDYLTVERVVEAYRNGGGVIAAADKVGGEYGGKHNSKFWRAVGERLGIV